MRSKKQNICANLIMLSILGFMVYQMRTHVTIVPCVVSAVMAVVMMYTTINSKRYALYNFPVFLFWGIVIILTLWMPDIIANKNSSFEWINNNWNTFLHSGIIKIKFAVLLVLSGVFIYISSKMQKWWLWGFTAILTAGGACSIAGYYLLRSNLINNFQTLIITLALLYTLFFRDKIKREDKFLFTGVSHKNIVFMIILLNLYVGFIYIYSSDYVNYLWGNSQITDIINSLLFGWNTAFLKLIFLIISVRVCNEKYIEDVADSKGKIKRTDLNESINTNALNAGLTLGLSLLIFQFSWGLFHNTIYCYVGIAAIMTVSAICNVSDEESSYLRYVCLPHIVVFIIYLLVGMYIWHYDLLIYIFHNPVIPILILVLLAIVCFFALGGDADNTILISGLIALLLVISYNFSWLSVLCISITTLFGVKIYHRYEKHVIFIMVFLLCTVALNYAAASGIKMEYICGDATMSDSVICISPRKSINKNEEMVFRWDDEEYTKVEGNDKYYMKTKDGTLKISTLNKTGEIKTQKLKFKSENKYEGEYPSVIILQ